MDWAPLWLQVVLLAFLSGRRRRWLPFGYVAIAGWQIGQALAGTAGNAGLLVVSGMGGFVQIAILLVAASLAAMRREVDEAPWWLATTSAWTLAGANDLAVLILAGTGLTVALAQAQVRLSARSAFESLMGGGLALGIGALGASWLFGLGGSTRFGELATKLASASHGSQGPILLSSLLLLGGIGAGWVGSIRPALLEEGGTPVEGAGFALLPILAGVIVTARLSDVALPAAHDTWMPLVTLMAIALMLGGSVLAFTRHRISQVVASLAVAQAGTILLCVLAASQTANAVEAGIALGLGLLSLVGSVLGATGVLAGADVPRNLAELRGFAGSARGAAWLLSASLVSLCAGPLTVGFWSRWLVIKATLGFANSALAYGYVWLAVLAALTSVMGAYPVWRVQRMVFQPKEGEPEPLALEAGPWAIALAAGALVLLGFWVPQPLWQAAASAAASF
jgi:NADH-quinone oxidoreductase subunit N